VPVAWLRVIITSATGLVGDALRAALIAAGHRVDRVSRRPPEPGTTAIQWDPARGELDSRALEGADAVVHLAGPWTASAKARIRKSRANGTRLVTDGRQYWSWIALADVVRVIERALGLESFAGPVNVAAPTSVTNRDFTRALGRPTLLPLPAPAVRLLMGEMRQALLLGSTRALPRRLERAGFRFQHPDLDGALRAALGRG
jgi:NAD dependent epimerase/dehydratase family enzyme